MRYFVVFLYCFCTTALGETFDFSQDDRRKKIWLFCERMDARLPKNIAQILSLAPVIKHDIKKDDQGFCDGVIDCSLHNVQLNGLYLWVLNNNETDKAHVLDISISSPNWITALPLRVGEKISVAESYFGVKLKQISGFTSFTAECAGVTIAHKNGVIERISTSCSNCI